MTKKPAKHVRFFTNKHANAIHAISKTLDREQHHTLLEAANEISRLEHRVNNEIRHWRDLEAAQWIRFNEQMKRADELETKLEKLQGKK